MFDVLSNHKIINFRNYAEQSVSDADQPDEYGVDTQEETAAGLFELNTRFFLIIEAATGNAGTLDIVVEHKNDNDRDFSTLCTLDQIDESGNYVAVVDGIKKTVRLAASVGTNAVSWNAKAVCFDARRRPVVQSDVTEVDVTYA